MHAAVKAIRDLLVALQGERGTLTAWKNATKLFAHLRYDGARRCYEISDLTIAAHQIDIAQLIHEDQEP